MLIENNYFKCNGKAPFEKEEAQYVYVLVRSDLSVSQQGVQAVHAGMAAIHKHGGLTDQTRLAMLSVQDECELRRYAEKASEAGLDFEIFWEPDNNTGWSALATAPISRKQGKIFKKLSMWNPERELMAA